jgi:hypothetical protein
MDAPVGPGSIGGMFDDSGGQEEMAPLPHHLLSFFE